MTTGLVDELPDVPGVAERWGHDVLHTAAAIHPDLIVEETAHAVAGRRRQLAGV